MSCRTYNVNSSLCLFEVGHRCSPLSSMPHWLALWQCLDSSRRDVYDWQSTQMLFTSASSTYLHITHVSCSCKTKKESKHLHRAGMNFKISLANKVALGLQEGILPSKPYLAEGHWRRYQMPIRICSKFRCCAHTLINLELFMEGFLSVLIRNVVGLIILYYFKKTMLFLQLYGRKGNLCQGLRTGNRFPVPQGSVMLFFLSRDQSRPDKALHLLPLTTHYESLGRYWLDHQTAGQILIWEMATAISRQCWLPAGTTLGTSEALLRHRFEIWAWLHKR